MDDSNNSQIRRRVERIHLPLPVRIETKESKEDFWDEISRFSSISRCGAGFEVKRQVKIGQLVLLTAPLPQKLRCYDYSEQQYKIWGVVRYCYSNADNQGVFCVGVAFIGKYAPLGFHENPAKLYNLVNFTKEGFSQISEAQKSFREESAHPQVAWEDSRKYPRYPIPTEIFLESLDRDGNTTGYETTVSENVSLNGAAIFTSLNAQPDELVKVSFISYNVSIVAKVCHRRIGADGITRLHLEFIDRTLPLEGIE